MKRPSLVIFDMDGLMFDSETVTFRCLKQALKEFGEELTFEEYVGLLGLSNADFHKFYTEKLPHTSPQELDVRAFELIMKSFREDGVPRKKGLIELLDYLESQGIRKVVATSTSQVVAEETLTLGGVYGRFDGYIYGDTVAQSKPNPEIFLKIAAAMGVAPADALVLEDSKNGILAAHTAGIPVIMVPDLIPPTPELLDMAVCKLDSLLDVIDFLETTK